VPKRQRIQKPVTKFEQHASSQSCFPDLEQAPPTRSLAKDGTWTPLKLSRRWAEVPSRELPPGARWHWGSESLGRIPAPKRGRAIAVFAGRGPLPLCGAPGAAGPMTTMVLGVGLVLVPKSQMRPDGRAKYLHNSSPDPQEQETK
jgi:hypothetical protein